jgi:hypothetical protein
MGRVGLIAGAVALCLVAAGAVFWSDIARVLGLVSEEQLVADLKSAATGGGYAVTFAQADAGKWQVGEGHRLEKFTVDSGTTSFARLTSSVPLNAETWEWSTQGLSTLFPVGFNNTTNGGKLQIGVIARAPSTNGSKAISVVYATQQAGNSGWHDLKIGPNFEMSTFTFDVPKRDPGTYTAQPIMVINADRSGGGASAEILGIYVKQIP